MLFPTPKTWHFFCFFPMSPHLPTSPPKNDATLTQRLLSYVLKTCCTQRRTPLLTQFCPTRPPAYLTEQIVDKQAFWSRVRTGKERVDTLAREVFCQTTLTIKGADDEDDGDGDGGLGSDVGVLGSSLEERFGEPSSPRRPSGAEAATEGGGIVRVHSIFETANDLVSEKE